MNERILALAASHFPRDGEGNIHATPEIIGEFAELIVRECAGLLDGEWEKEILCGSDAAGILLAHFGVES